MKNILVASIVVLLIAQRAFAIKPATDTEKIAIQNQIFAANRMDADVKDAEARVFLAQSANASPDKIRALQLAVARERDRQTAARTVAIHMTILAYDLKPANSNGISTLGWTKGRSIAWLPVAREPEARKLQNADGKQQDQPQPKEALAGKTYIDGVAYIYPESFEKGVGYLASTLLHESIHFDQITTPGRGGVITIAESEAEAYGAEKTNELIFFNPGIKDDALLMADTDSKLADYAAKFDQEKKERKTISGRIRSLLPPRTDPSEMFESKVHTDAELTDIHGLVDQARVQAERQMKTASAAASDRRRAKALRDIAVLACVNPDNIAVGEVENLPRGFSPDMDLPWPDALGDGCARALYFYLIAPMKPGEWQTKATIRDFVHSYFRPPAPLPPPSPSVPSPEEPSWVAKERERRQLIDSLNDSVQFAQQFLKSACRSGAALSDESLEQFRAALIHVNRDGAPVGYDRTTIAAGLGQCEMDLLDQFHSRFGDFNYMRDVRAAVSDIWQRRNSHRRKGGDDDSDDHSHPDPCRRHYGDYCNG